MSAAAQTLDGPGPAHAGSGVAATCTINGEVVELERVSGRKASRALAQLRRIGKAMPSLQNKLADYEREYEASNYVELDRVQARLRYPQQRLVDADGMPLYEPAEINGEPNPKAGEPMWLPSPIDLISEADWEQTGGVLRRPKSPEWGDKIFAIFPDALEEAEEDVYRLLALFLLSNAEVKELWRSGGLDAELKAKADDLIDDALGDEIMELAVVVSELVDDQFVRKARQLGGRLGNLGRLVGLEPTSLTLPTTPTPAPPSGPSSLTPTSSTDSPVPTDGGPTPSSTPPGSFSVPSEDESPETESSSNSEQPVVGAMTP